MTQKLNFIRVIFYFGLLSFLLVSCEKKTVVQGEMTVIDVDPNKAIDYIMADDYFDSEIIRLEKTAQSLIGNADEVVIYNDLVFVLDVHIAKALFVFDRNGKFIRTIGQKGHAEGEYLYLESFAVRDDRVYLLCGFDRKLLVYTVDGEFVKETKLEGHGGHNLYLNPDGSFVSIGSETLHNVLFWGKDGELEHVLRNSDYGFVNWSMNKPISEVNGVPYISTMFSDTIYEVDEHHLIGRYVFNFGSKRMPIEDLKNKEDFEAARISENYVDLEAFVVSEKFVYACFTYKRAGFHGLLIKETGQFVLTKNFICNNILLNVPVGELRNGIIYALDPSFVNSIVSNNNIELFRTEIQVVKPDDNPILFILTAKKYKFE